MGYYENNDRPDDDGKAGAVCLLCLALIAGVLLGLVMSGGYRIRETDAPQVKTTTVTFRDTVTDTVRIDRPVLVERLRVRMDTVALPVVSSDVAADFAEVEVPVESSVYSDSTYRAWVSGFRARLDSIEVYPMTVTERTTVTQTVKVPKRWGLGVQAGVGFTPQGKSPYIGVGVNYNILTW